MITQSMALFTHLIIGSVTLQAACNTYSSPGCSCYFCPSCDRLSWFIVLRVDTRYFAKVFVRNGSDAVGNTMVPAV